MFPGNPNPFLQATPGKVVLDIQRKRMPSGQIVEIRTVEETVLENGRWRREKVREYDPDMADGTRPDIGLIRECHVCLHLWHAVNVTRCIACGRDYCRFRECRGEVRMSEDEIIILCAPCARANNTGLLSRLSRKFWRLGK
jgi:hypothetical protein